ncbi:retrovirus-related pol polyprotein from transposon TNT 1-94 [Tanacetum coccineum]|uniref:Retrovirus-related pol polyprotein from transposon TNT 1-94 n=1 Tax=Tanacetum coccineum TaxID=301880 RepID=A0ABQ5BB73_9ASTR
MNNTCVALAVGEVVSPSVVDETVVKEKQSPLVNSTGLGSPMQETPSASTAPWLFSFQFSSMEGFNTMLENGPWFIRNNPLILKKWHPDVNLLKEDVGTILVWVKLYGVPITAFSEDDLSE